MLSKVELTILLLDEYTDSVAGYFFDRLQNIVFKSEFIGWTKAIPLDVKKLKLSFTLLSLEHIFVELSPLRQSGIVNLIDKNSKIVRLNIDIKSTIIYAQSYAVPIFIDKAYLIKNGLYVSKSAIEEILKH